MKSIYKTCFTSVAYLYKMQRFTKNVIKEAVKTRLLFTKYGCVLLSAAIFFTYFLTLIFSMRLKKAGRLAANFCSCSSGNTNYYLLQYCWFTAFVCNVIRFEFFFFFSFSIVLLDRINKRFLPTFHGLLSRTRVAIYWKILLQLLKNVCVTNVLLIWNFVCKSMRCQVL